MFTARTPSAVPRVTDLARQVRAEFEEMPGMHLTFSQVRRVWSLSDRDCDAVLNRLLETGHLKRDAENRFCRAEEDR